VRFKRLLARLPAEVQAATAAAFTLFQSDPFHPALANHELVDTKKGRHRKASRSIAVTRRYRAIYVVDGPTNVWYWIGSHEDYNNFVGKM
jgi:hypothetical protein